MRVRCPLPLVLNHSTTSLSRRRWTEVFPPGITTRALLQKSTPRDSASGASGLVLSSPRSRMALIWSEERRTVVDLSFISARFLGTDDADQIFATPGEHDPIHVHINSTERNPTDLSIIFPVVDRSSLSLAKIAAPVRNETRCLRRLARAFSLSHSNRSSTSARCPFRLIIHNCVHERHEPGKLILEHQPVGYRDRLVS